MRRFLPVPTINVLREKKDKIVQLNCFQFLQIEGKYAYYRREDPYWKDTL